LLLLLLLLLLASQLFGFAPFGVFNGELGSVSSRQS
jgi:hypothetical protein